MKRITTWFGHVWGWRIYVWLFSLFLVGMVLMLWEGGFLVPIRTTIGMALLTATVLGVSIDIGFRTRVTRDVFLVAFGYLLPKEIREEVRWIYGIDRLAVEYSHTFKITAHPTNDEKVLLTQIVRRVRLRQ